MYSSEFRMTIGPTPPPVEVTSAPVGIMQHLLPNGRAFRITATKYLRKLFEGLTAAMIPPFREAVDTAYQDLPPATTTRLADWQSLWGIMYPSTTDQRAQLTRAWSYQGSPTLAHIQAAIRAEGFDVYVHEGYGINPLTYIAPTTVNPLGTAPLGYPLVNKLFTADKNYSALCGEADIACGEIEASCGYYQYSIWTPKLYVVPSGSPYFVYIGGQTLGQLVYIDPVRRNEFEALCLKLVPSHLWIGAMVQYDNPSSSMWIGFEITPPVEPNNSLMWISGTIYPVPTDYIHYYPLTVDFNDHTGSNNLANTGCSIDANGCLIDAGSDKLTITNGIPMSGGFTIAFTYTPSILGLSVGLFGETGNSQIFRIEDSSGSWGSYTYGTTATPKMDLSEQKFAIIQEDATRKYYRNGILCLTQTTDTPVLKYIGNFVAGSYPALGYWKDIKIFNRAVTEAEAIQLTTE